MLEMAHQDYGRQAWSSLFEPAIRLATDGFVISPRMAAAIQTARNDLLRDSDASTYFLNPDLSAKSVGTVLRNPDYAATLATIAREGAQAFYTGPIAEEIVNKIKVTRGSNQAPVAITPGLTELSDLANYRAVRREPVCRPYRHAVVCGMGPPSTGGIAVAQILGILEHFELAAHRPSKVHGDGGHPSVAGVHLISEAERLAYADRQRYVADTDFVPLPGRSIDTLLDPSYLASRAALISTQQSMGIAKPGVFSNIQAQGDNTAEGNGTTHVSLVDRAGNVVVMTSTIESGMGSFHFTRGFLLNNQLTDFSFQSADASGPIANRLQPLKRPASAMSPTIVFKRKEDGSRGEFLMATGSPGGPSIIQYVVKTLTSVLDWGLDAQQATSMVNFGASNSATTHVGGEHPEISPDDDPLVSGLRALGHTVSTTAQSSGVATIMRLQNPPKRSTQSALNQSVYVGGADPRREGIALGGHPRLDR
jgi:gamma-glutamyltranspeptidase/glutathione hydrolase